MTGLNNKLWLSSLVSTIKAALLTFLFAGQMQVKVKLRKKKTGVLDEGSTSVQTTGRTNYYDL